ncbi:unnamed protein product [Vitrella brassicaformis CCMP3155]|uniref:Glycosyltransferase subfamily 4-like N-terminal domain-containing protein n=2 Tax=Vitrella brassicaformis TaxID=1169539 RepID=A0A0G4F5F5_VITBC|nr:unnamed protein product [Vitrella brassicaformis CCMP3155]|eukprot:CEM06974.1 unnamed protein product [Vitrella brassicaformis CCMP3155]
MRQQSARRAAPDGLFPEVSSTTTLGTGASAPSAEEILDSTDALLDSSVLPVSSPTPRDVLSPDTITIAPPKKIALLVEPTPFTYISGYANRFKELLKHCRRQKDTVEIVTPDDSTNPPKEAYGFRIHNTWSFRLPFYKSLALSTDFPDFKGLRVLKRLKPDLLHVSTPGFLAMTACLYARLLKIPLVMSYHTHLPVYAAKYLGWLPGIVWLSWLALRLFHNLADLTLVTSPQIKSELESHGIQKVDVWQKGIDTETFNPTKRSAAMRSRLSDGHPDDPLLVYIGRLGAEKNLHLLRDVLERVPEARLAFVGAGPCEDELREYFNGTKTVFTGFMTGEALSEAFASGDIFVMPSESETLGFVVLESMASGVPVIGARAGGIPNLIRHGETGFLVQSDDVQQYVDRVRELLSDDALRRRMGEAARREAEQWSWEASMAKLRNIQYPRAILNFRRRMRGGFARLRSRLRLIRIFAVASAVWALRWLTSPFALPAPPLTPAAAATSPSSSDQPTQRERRDVVAFWTV